jgi:hypothetical protein
MGAKPYASTLPLLLSLLKTPFSPHHDPFAFPSYSRNGNAIVELWIKKYKINIGLIFGACRPSVKLNRTEPSRFHSPSPHNSAWSATAGDK